MINYVIIGISVLIIVAWVMYKWHRASTYVKERNAIYSEFRAKEREYSQRCKQDKRWQGFLNILKEKYNTTETQTDEKGKNMIHEVNIADFSGNRFEANAEESETVSMWAYLKRSSRPKYLQIELTSNKQIVERKIREPNGTICLKSLFKLFVSNNLSSR